MRITNQNTSCLFIGLVVGVLFAPLYPAAAQVRRGKAAATSKVIRSTDGITQITVPAGWNPVKDLNDSATIQVSKANESLYALVITDEKTALSSDMTLEKYAALSSKKLTDSLTELEQGEPQPIPVNGRQALLKEVRGTVDGVRAAFYFVAIETDKYFHQIGIWTFSSKFEVKRTAMRSVIDSFREITKPSTGR